MRYQYLESKHLVQTYIRRGLTIVKGKGVWVYDSKGKKYLDFMSGIGVNILGHSHFGFNKALRTQISSLINLHGSLSNDKRALTAQKLVKLMPETLKRVYFCNSGTEAIEAAIKFAYLARKKPKIVVGKNAYHGKSLGALSLMGNEEYRSSFASLLYPEVEFIEFNNVWALKKAVDKNTLALFLEPVQGEAGIIPAKKEFLQTARKVCDNTGALLCFDEAQSGMGRTGRLLACEHFSVYPDILCLAKGLGGGIPMGAVLLTEKVHQAIPRGIHTSTFGGNPLACNTSLFVLDWLTEKRLKQIGEIGVYFLTCLKQVKSDKVKEIRGIGLMIGVELGCKITPVVKKMQELGLLCIPTKENIIRFLPPLIIEREHIKRAVNIFKKSLE
jgi:LysW-gamma-L-lysine/LysW-L-ornithine aminotransferase